ncbi:histone-lysine N-methyltransferase EHMT2-like [Tigriopus californicus]|uniref:histone-lysine N-methyltransferase EHMT2-like n=1 Tax=Tigriopus californicus TaxID=6832 RepID=UPI0027DAAD4D|nr:histone-lysine N-methyltransferase EHMT2-like [Tigriopus californicus]
MGDKSGWTPLHRCCQEKPPLHRQEEDNEAPEEKPEEQPKSDQKEAIAQEDEKRAKIAEMLLNNGAKATAVEPAGQQTPLHLLCMNGYAQTAKVLLEAGEADVNAVNKISQTPLIYACIERHLDTVKIMVEFKADLSLGDKLHWNWTPLHYAVLQDDVDIVQFLLDSGADKEAKDEAGRSALNVADEHPKKKSRQFWLRDFCLTFLVLIEYAHLQACQLTLR